EKSVILVNGIGFCILDLSFQIQYHLFEQATLYACFKIFFIPHCNSSSCHVEVSASFLALISVDYS
ncbi:MAG: hypothetical protein ACE5I1_17610, partial [bacterium]